MLRSVTAVCAGFAIFTIGSVMLVQISGRFPGDIAGASSAILTIVYGAAIGGLAGFITARVAITRPLVHAIVLAALVLGASALSSLFFQGPDTSRWSFLATVFVDGPAVVLGGVLACRRHPGRGRGAPRPADDQ